MPDRPTRGLVRSASDMRLLLPVTLLLVTLHPSDTAAQNGLHVSASVALSGTYDDNVFAVPERERPEVISRLTPRLGLAYRSRRFDVGARYARDAERFSRNRELSTLSARQDAVLDLRWSPARGFEMRGSATYAETHSPGEFSMVTGLDEISGMDLIGLELRRALARRVLTTGSISRRLGARTRAVVEHGFTRDEIVGSLTSATHAAGARIDRQVGPHDTVSLGYAGRLFTAAGERTTAHAVTLAWARAVTPRARLELKVGPRFSDGGVGPELSATLRHRFRQGEAALSYVQTETAVVGQPAPVTAQGVSAAFSQTLGRWLTVTAGPSLFQARGHTLEATVYGVGVDVNCRLARGLSLSASHQLSLQQGSVGGVERGEIVHNVSLLRLVAGSAH